MQLLSRALSLFAILLGGCSYPPTKVTLETNQSVQSTATVSRILPNTGARASGDSSCNLPCTINIIENEKYRVRIDAKGYLPAVVEFNHEMALQTATALGDSEQTKLVIPLFKRTSRSNK